MSIATTLHSSADWATIVAAIVAVVVALSAVVAFFARRTMRWLNNQLSELTHKTSMNGGTSLDLGDTSARIETKLDETRTILLFHLAHHPGESLPPTFIPPPAPTTETMLPTRAEIEARAIEDERQAG